MPRKPYTKFMNAGTRKLSTPMGRFTLLKYYYVRMPAPGAAPAPAAVLRIKNGTPFQPLTVVSGTWTANDTNNEVSHIGEKPWVGYNHLVVAGSRVEAVVKDSVDKNAESPYNQHEGIVRITRSGGSATIGAATTNTALRDVAYSKGRALQLSKTTVVALPTNTKVQMGYSARKVWNANPMGQDQLRVANLSGSANAPTDDTYTYLSIHLANENLATETLKDFKVQLKITYFIKFQEPNVSTNIPRPIPQKSQKKKSTNKQQTYLRWLANNPPPVFMNPVNYMAAAGMAGLAVRNRRRALR